MDYRNSDGSFAEMCGNGIRCLGKYVYDNGLTDQKELLVETRAGARNLELFTGLDGKVESVRVNMGPPLFDPQDIPASIEATHIPIVDHLFEVCGRRFLASLVSMGNPHCVILYDGDIRGLPTTYGPSIESLPIFPEKTNVEFVSTVNRNVVMMRVWERGSGETFACGTGACAAAVVTILKGLTDTPVTVQLLGGELQIEWKGQNADVFMMGPAVTVYDGVITI